MVVVMSLRDILLSKYILLGMSTEAACVTALHFQVQTMMPILLYVEDRLESEAPVEGDKRKYESFGELITTKSGDCKSTGHFNSCEKLPIYLTCPACPALDA